MEPKLARFVVASSLAALVGVWNLGEQIGQHSLANPDSLQFSLLERYEWLTQQGLIASLLRGAVFLSPLMLVALGVCRFWAELFARIRQRSLDPGWWFAAWIFALLVPATLPLTYVAIALSFGVVFGCHVFGGTGRYIVNPALLGVVFLAVAYPDFVGDTQWLPGAELPTTWSAIATAPANAAARDAWGHLFGREIGAIGTASALACLLGGLLLIALRSAAVGTVAGGVVAVLFAGALFGTVSPYEHVALGQFAFLLAFVATDPTTRPITTAGEWAYGAFFGVLVVSMRMANPSHPEASAHALLLACLCVPLFDEIARRSRLMRSAAAERKDV